MTRSRKTKKPLSLNKRSVRKLDEQHMKKAAGGMTLTCADCVAYTDGCPVPSDACATDACDAYTANTCNTLPKKQSAYC